MERQCLPACDLKAASKCVCLYTAVISGTVSQLRVLLKLGPDVMCCAQMQLHLCVTSTEAVSVFRA